MSRIFMVVFSLTALVSTIILSRAQDHPSPAPNDYGKAESWLCRPGRHDACDVDMTTTVISANGKLTKETWAANPKAPIDCFYVYPTVSTDESGNSDMIANTEELNVIRAQA